MEQVNSILKSFQLASKSGKLVRYLEWARWLAIGVTLLTTIIGVSKTVTELKQNIKQR